MVYRYIIDTGCAFDLERTEVGKTDLLVWRQQLYGAHGNLY